MAKNLIIVESPTKTKTISKILGRDYKVLASKGHLRDLPKSSFGVDIENNFEPRYINVRGKAPIINELKKESKKADKVYLATDPDREGEAISWHLSGLLGLDINDNNRVSFHEITPEGVKKGMKEPRSIDMDLVDSQQARRIMDRIVGYEISPLLWKKVKSGLSAGRVQSVALKLIVDREREIEAYVAEEYWSIEAGHKEGEYSFSSSLQGRKKGSKIEKLSLSNEKEAEDIRKSLDHDFIVDSVTKKKRSRKAYPPFTTSSLQQEASRSLGFSTSKTMTLAQQLYEGLNIKGRGQVGLITYMRTDSTRLSNTFIDSALAYIKKKYGNEYASKGISYAGRKGAQDAHEAVRPAFVELNPMEIRDSLTDDQYKLYNMIWKRSLASQMTPSISKSTKLDMLSGDMLFRVNGIEQEFDGFQLVWPVSEKAVLLPEIKKGDLIRARQIRKKQHFTQPPARYSEASLVNALEKNGIGRPSTYSSIIRSVQNRRYVKLEKKQFFPTKLGVNVYDFLSKHFSNIINEDFTSQMEERLDDIADGDTDWRELMKEFYNIFSKDLEEAKNDEESYRTQAEKTGDKCPVCGHDLVIRHGRNGDFIGCSNFPECSYTKSIIKSTGVKCPRCKKGEIIEKVSKMGKIFYGCSSYPECDYASWDKPTGEVCELCGDLMVHKKNRKEDRIYCHNEDCPNHSL